MEEEAVKSPPVISVIVPVRNDPLRLGRCLCALRQSTYAAMEVLVMDDASTDDTPAIAQQLGARVIRMEKCGGPGRARNRGAELAAGRYIMFVDADVCVHPQTIERVMHHFEQEPTLDALFGSYDDKPDDRHFVSQYKNLQHHYVHQRASERATTFWSGCGAIRREVFMRFGGFNVDYGRPSIEDIELGVRLHQAGLKIAVKKDVHATHLKRWTLWGLIKTDVRDRGIPWTRLILERDHLPNDLNLGFSQRLSALMAYGLIGVLVVALASLAGWVPFLAAWIGLALALLIGIVCINHDFYTFLVRVRGLLFAAGAVPLHVLYYLYSGVALMIGTAQHYWSKSSGVSSGQGRPDDAGAEEEHPDTVIP
jgi:glycosyltransferase involved in cell wall biosynthesis